MMPRDLAALILSSLLVLAWPAAAQQAGPPAIDEKDAEQRVVDTFSAVVRVRMRAVPDARSNATLGAAREGSGIVIEPGYVLTIGYLVIESDSIEVTTVNDKTLPATLAGYDHASGFGLLKIQGDLGVKPLPLGDSAALGVREPVIILPHGGRESASMAYVMSKRRFAGSWEYLLDSAIFTAPPTMAWAGAALVNRRLELVGVGSLLVRETVEQGTPQPGNMFVPIDLLKPILAEMKAKGRAGGPQRPWLGMNTEQVKGGLVVSRVSPEGPAAKAGVRQGDIVVAIGNDPVASHEDLYRKLWALGAAGVEVPLKVQQGVDVRDVRVKSIDRFDYFKSKPAF
jgi:S1-C subfamily serine protease